MKQKPYRFNFDKGVPVLDWPHGKRVIGMRWRKTSKTVKACSMLEAIRKLVQPIVQEYGYNAKVELHSAFRNDGGTWIELNHQEPIFAAFMLGQFAATERAS